MATTFAEPTVSFSTSTVRAPYSTPAAPSMADTLPVLNFGFEELRSRMNTFTQKFDEFIERGRKRVLEERNHFRMRVAEVQENQSQRLREIAELTSESSDHASALEAQNKETEEIKATVASLTSTRDSHAANVATLKHRLATAQASIKSRKAAQQDHARYLSHQQNFDQPELQFWEGYLGLRIEGTGVDDKVKFVFAGCDPRRAEREALFELDMSAGSCKRSYEVTATQPNLERDKVRRCVERMCDTEDLAAFLKGMRELFVEAFR